MDINDNNRDNLLTAVWLLATLNGEGARKAGRKSVTKIDIVETCQCIIEVSDTLNLRRTSNLMYGTVLAYKSKCLWNWKEVNSCRMLIRRLGMMTTKNNTLDNNIKENGEVAKGSEGIKLLADDPKFDIMFGLVEEFEEFSPNKNGSKTKHVFEKSISGSDSNSSDGDEFFKAKEIPVSTQEKWDEAELDFQFDADGNVIQLKGDGDTDNVVISEAEIRDSFVDFNAFDEVPEFDLNFDNNPLPQIEESNAEPPVQELLTPPATKRQKTGKNRQPAKKKLIFDIETCFTGVQLRDIRDGYIVTEKEKLKGKYTLARRIEREAELKALTDVTKYSNGYTNKVREVNERNDDRLPSFEDIEYGRERMESRSKSRSSSVSSVEVGRRALDSRHSSSFRFDFSQREGDNTVGEANVADIAQMDISFGLENLDEFDEIASVGRVDIESFEEELRCSVEKGTARFSDLAFANNAKEASRKFMFVLELATKNRVRVSQESLFSEIYIELN